MPDNTFCCPSVILPAVTSVRRNSPFAMGTNTQSRSCKCRTAARNRRVRAPLYAIECRGHEHSCPHDSWIRQLYPNLCGANVRIKHLPDVADTPMERAPG